MSFKIKHYSILVVTLALVTTACDKVPGLYRLGKNEVIKHYHEGDVDNEDIEAAYKVAQANCCSEDTLKNDIEALNLYCQAAKAGHKPSMVEAGKMYLNIDIPKSTIIPHDKALAFTFFSVAERAGYDHAIYLRKSTLHDMSEQEFARATRLIESYPVVPCEITR